MAESNSSGKIFAAVATTVAVLLVFAVLGQRGSVETYEVIPTDEADVSLASLLHEMTDRSALATWPAHPWTHGHRSSTVPATGPEAKSWHSNNDVGHYAGMSLHGGKQYVVLLKQDGPGVITRIWSANPAQAGVLSVYIDDQPEPIIEESMALFLSGRGTAPPPFAGVRGRGATSYLPIPYAKSVRVAVDQKPASGLYYGIDYRTYAEGTKVQSYAPEHLLDARASLAAATDALRKPVDPEFRGANEVDPLVWKRGSSGAINGIRLSFPEGTDPSHLRLRMHFDNEAAIDVPVGGFFGSGKGVNPFSDWDRTVTATSMTARWVMPFQQTATVQIHADEPVEGLALEVATIPWEWDDRSLYFGASDHTELAIPTRPYSDWPFADIQGARGFYVGDSLAVYNPVDDWWGAGDERFWVDGVLAQLGTGTEDYYGYAYCSNEVFSGPFGGQPRNDQQPGEEDCGRSSGHVTNTRVRMLDRILFSKDLIFQLEIWHHGDTAVDYSGTAFWYARRSGAPPE